MTDHPDKLFSPRRQLELMQQLQKLANERAAAEKRIAEEFAAKTDAAQARYDEDRPKAVQQFSATRRDLENEFSDAKLTAAAEFRRLSDEARTEFDNAVAQASAQNERLLLEIDRRAKDAEWQAMAVFDSAKDLPGQVLDDSLKRLSAWRAQLDGLQRDALTLMSMRRLSGAASEMPAAEESSLIAQEDPSEAKPEKRLQEVIAKVHQGVLDLQSQWLPTILLEPGRLPIWLLGSCVPSVGLAWLAGGWSPWLTPLLTVLFAVAITGVIYALLRPRARRQSTAQFTAIVELLHEGRRLDRAATRAAKQRCQSESQEIASRRDLDVAAARKLRDTQRRAAEERHGKLVAESEKAFETRLELLAAENEAAIAQAEEKFPPLLDDLAKQRAETLEHIDEHLKQQKEQAKQEHDQAWDRMAAAWHEGFAEVVGELTLQQETCREWFPAWDRLDIATHEPPARALPAVSFGRCLLPLSAVKNGLSADERLVPERTQLELPAWMPLGEMPRMIVTAGPEGRAASVDVLRMMMLRFLVGAPAGKLRFTIIDAASMGEGLAAFMHLADEDEQLVGGRIWTDPREIDERLGEVVLHMEKVLQKYLRNEFETLDEFNRRAGEVAEPYHVVVVSGFPKGLTDNAIRKLERIATSGARCGVFTLLGVDTSEQLPNDFDLSALTQGAVHLDWSDGRMVWRYPLYEKLALEIEPLPERRRMTDLLVDAGRRSREASRVEVPFAEVAPKKEQLWTGDASRELVVPIGRAGATDTQALSLGRGTAQHVLVAGKTGSGKSTLLHALVTNTALHYSPDEVELYLVDFKKGVEFKAYANGNLPHARVIAIESEREFGVSVLERLDEELRRRGELFRLRGVQNLADFRRAAPDEVMPRVLLVIDEFQELFVADDKLAQDASLLLDRLVRQGRAFGVHVLLGSQTLGGAYSLARTTIGQMAVRIALECSEADAHLILSDENMAARYLSRPGEAIYNDQNGLTAANELFQVVWLPDAERRGYLETISQLQARSGREVPPPIVFEGNAPSDPALCEPLSHVLESPPADEFAEPVCWLGSAVRIGPPTQLTFRRQSGNHLLAVAGEEALAVGVLSTALVAAVAQQQELPPQVTVLDGTRRESPLVGAWGAIADSLGVDARVVGVKETAAVMAALAEEVSRRSQSADEQHADWYLVVHDLGQFRDLRKTEEDFSFSSSKEVTPDRLFRDILREGPGVGVHVLVWSDSYNAMNRSIDRLSLREIDYRVAFQMSSADSTGLIDSPLAARLGENRALLYRDDLGTLEKFRPHSRPSVAWLSWVAERLRKRHRRAGAER